jgi:hypothetical protein
MGVKLESFTLREQHKLRVSENRVLRGVEWIHLAQDMDR